MSVTQKNYAFSGPAGLIEGIAHLPPDEPRAIAVVAHPLPTLGGHMDNKVAFTLARVFADLGCATLRFNFRGVGNSEGEFSHGEGETEDMLAVVQYAREQFGEDLPLLLGGFSFGAYVASRAAQQLHPQHLVLAGPSVKRLAMPPKVSPDTLVIHGELDEVVPLAEVMDWARPQHLPVVVLPGAEHFFHGRLTQLRDLVLRHFRGVAL
jgi:alpha/beta superfamily hydrolase